MVVTIKKSANFTPALACQFHRKVLKQELSIEQRSFTLTPDYFFISKKKVGI